MGYIEFGYNYLQYVLPKAFLMAQAELAKSNDTANSVAEFAEIVTLSFCAPISQEPEFTEKISEMVNALLIEYEIETFF